MKKTFLLVLALIMVASMGFAIGTGQNNQVNLRFSWWGTDARHEATLNVIAAFERANPNIKIEPEYGAQTGYNEKKTTEFASRTAPDMFQIETGAGPEYQKLGVLYNLSRLSSIRFDRFDANYLRSAGQFGTGSQWAIPTGVGGSALVVNKTLADRLGIDLTRQYDWDQLLTWGQQVRTADPTAYLLSVNTNYGMDFFVRAYARQLNANGAPIINDTTKSLNTTEAQFTQIFDFIDRMYKTGTAAPAAYKAPFADQDENDPNWIAGRYVAHVGYTSSADRVAAANPSAAYIAGRMPVLANARNDGWFNNPPQYMGVYAYTRYAEEAGKFFDFFFNTEEAARLLGTVRSVPPTAFAQRIAADLNLISPILAAVTEMSLSYNGLDDAGLTGNQESQNILRAIYEEVAYGRLTAAAAASRAVQQLNAFIARQ